MIKTKKKIILNLIFLVFMFRVCHASELTISFVSEPKPELIVLNIELQFEKNTNIYHWASGESIYPILNKGLYVECYNIDSGEEVFFMTYPKILPKFPMERDVLKTSSYSENLKLIPGKDYVKQKLKRGRYSLMLRYDTKELKKYPGGKDLSFVQIKSNEVLFQIK